MSRLSALSLLVITTWIGAFIVHSVLANMYYRLNYVRLQNAADMAVRAGALYLPADPMTAMRVADAYGKLNGIAPGEIAFIQVAPDRHTLWIRLDYKMPTYVTLFAVGLPSREIAVMASARGQSDRAAAIRKISWRTLDQPTGRGGRVPRPASAADYTTAMQGVNLD